MVVAFMYMEIEGVSAPIMVEALVVQHWYRYLMVKLPKSETCEFYYIPMTKEQYMSCMIQYLASRETVLNLTNFMGYPTTLSKDKKELIESYCAEYNARVM